MQDKRFPLRLFSLAGLFLAGVLFCSFLSSHAVLADAVSDCLKDKDAKGAPKNVYVSIPVNGKHCIPVGSGSLQENVIFKFLVIFIQFLSVGVGLAVVGGIVYGAVLYTTARANAAQAEKGRNVIINSLIGLLLFIFMYAILQFLIPGGVFQ